MANDVFNEKESIIIEKTLDASLKMIDALTGDKELTKEQKSEFRLLSEVINGAVGNINSIANTRLKAVSDENQADTQNRALEILKNISRTKKPTGITIDVQTASMVELSDMEIVEGETKDGYEELSLADFVRGNKDDNK